MRPDVQLAFDAIFTAKCRNCGLPMEEHFHVVVDRYRFLFRWLLRVGQLASRSRPKDRGTRDNRVLMICPKFVFQTDLSDPPEEKQSE